MLTQAKTVVREKLMVISFKLGPVHAGHSGWSCLLVYTWRLTVTFTTVTGFLSTEVAGRWL